MTLLNIIPALDDYTFYPLIAITTPIYITGTVFILWAGSTGFFTDFWKKDYWRSKFNRTCNISMGACFVIELAILIYHYTR